MTLDVVQLVGIASLALLAGYFAGCARAAYVDRRRRRSPVYLYRDIPFNSKRYS